ncbi:DNA cytosine methyltransferase [Burkholderia humptydooensis]|uniref:DNA (cytosine-5-)-methyltransferase n=2 Tax=Burkholderia humptydooensis TaxID=430531 RepID=A0A7U4SVY8_9BURK|nr:MULTISPECIES: DNA cytosine methyltransferase [Burkholderia]AJY38650.1 C-5 cytosine-specific DNA methylase family protein [Burkholderia sp. 2002721687]ALX46448.1 DNA methyltransferase [Burkholderia humptydooensis]EIP85881.1 putative cytosine-specific modification methylase [Burkholderia humptydooensis MSMB43]QPS45757.1 DNA cytosine methyltransferase [Burkholderia humptydooensis]
MKRDLMTLPLDLGSELIIDNFAGGGGASTGLERAFGRPVDVAINHDREALAMHAANHPQTAHYCESVFDVDPVAITGNQPVGLVWLSPDCKHFSKAKGGKPVSKKIRGLAWIALRWCLKTSPRAFMLENVEEFVTWADLIEISPGKWIPDPAKKGETFEAFIDMLTTGVRRDHPALTEACEVLGIPLDGPEADRLAAGLGYDVEYRMLRACDYGAPTIRKRLFVVGRRDHLPIVWPAPTHGDPKSAAVRAGALQPWRTAADCIDWSIPCPSIFERERPLKDATLRRIARGIMKFVVNSADPFIVKFSQNSTGQMLDEPFHTVMAGAPRFGLVVPTLVQTGYGERAGQSPRVPGLDKPLGTVVAGSAKHALVSAFLAKHYGGHESPGAAAGAPISTITTQDHHHLVTAQLVGCGGRAAQSRPRDAGEPTATITAKADTAVAVSHLVKLRGTCRDGSRVDEPLHTISAGGTHHAEVRAFLVAYYGNDKDGADLRDPMRTVPTHDRFGLVTIHGEDYAIVDIGMRMLTPRELARAQGFPDSYVLDPIVNGKPLSKSAQVRMIGNSVAPDVATALIRANFAHEQQLAHAAA